MTDVMTVAAWREMSLHMGLENQGGPSFGFQRALPTPTVPLGASHEDAMRARGTHGAGAHEGHTPAAPAKPAAARETTPDPHAGHVSPASAPSTPTSKPAARTSTKPAAKPSTKPAATNRPKAPSKPAPKPVDPHAGHRP